MPSGLDLLVIIGAAIVALAGIALLAMLWRTRQRLLAVPSWSLWFPCTRGGSQRRAGG